MTVQEILALSNAGFTKEEILALASTSTSTETKQTEPTKAEPPEVVEQPKVVEPPKEEVKRVVDDETIQAFLQTIAGVTSSIDVPPTYKVEDKLTEHFNYLMVGDNKKGEK